MKKGLKIGLIVGLCVLSPVIFSSCIKEINSNTLSIIESSNTVISERERYVNENFSYPYKIDYSYSKFGSMKSASLSIPIFSDALLINSSNLLISTNFFSYSIYLDDTFLGFGDLGLNQLPSHCSFQYSYFSYNNTLFRINWGYNYQTLFDFLAILTARYQNSSIHDGNAVESFYASFSQGNGPNGAGLTIQSSLDYLSIYQDECWKSVSSCHDGGWFELLFHDVIDFSVDYFVTITDSDNNGDSGSGSGTSSGSGIGGGGGGSW